MSTTTSFISEESLYLFGQGTHQQAYRDLGAHKAIINAIPGVRFAVWAPNARFVSVVGDFNGWSPQASPMNLRGDSGVWETFVPGAFEGQCYKFHIINCHGEACLKADPFAFASELRPKTASVVSDIDDYLWNDQEWLQQRGQTPAYEGPLSIYEVHLGSWRRGLHDGNRFLSYRELAEQLVPYVKELGFNYIELLPVAEHPLDQSWGYQVIGYYAVTSRYGPPRDFKYFVDKCHQEGIGVIVDWVPAHFPKNAEGLGRFDGTCMYEHEDPRQGEHPDWGTYVFNYGRNEVRSFLLSNAHFWFDVYHVDGLRVDAVASMLYLDYSRKEGEWIPNAYGGRENLAAIELLKAVNGSVSARHPGICMIAEESTAWPLVSHPADKGGLGFHFKWNMGWMHDILEFMSKDPIYRKYHMRNVTFGLLYAFTENFILPLSHDEVVYGKQSLLAKMPGLYHERFANLRLLLLFMYGYPGKKLLFMGGEFGQWSEWNAEQSLEWHLLEKEPHRGIQKLVKDINRMYMDHPALYEMDFRWDGFEWIDFQDTENQTVSFIRRGCNHDDFLAFVFNLTPVPRGPYRIGVPTDGRYRELLNTDATFYGGTGMGNLGAVCAEPVPCHGRPFSISVSLPPLAGLVFKRE